jgi:hypothetical protein
MTHQASAAIACLLTALSLSMTPVANAQEARPDNSANNLADNFDTRDHWELQIAPFGVHWSNDPGHKHVYLIGIELNRADNPRWADQTVWGFSYFHNSFGQPSAYAYFGYRWDNLFGNPALYAKITGGILYGYKKPYENKVPFNHNGFSPAIIPALGYRITQLDAIQIDVLGTAGLIFTYNRRF